MNKDILNVRMPKMDARPFLLGMNRGEISLLIQMQIRKKLRDYLRLYLMGININGFAA